MSEQQIYIDGKFYPKSEAKISVFDHGLLYGDGVFEGIRAYNGKVFLRQEHIDRLYEGAHFIRLKIPLSKAEMAAALDESLKVNNLENGYIRLVVTRGVGDLGLDPNKCPKATVIIIAASIKLYPEEFYEKGLALITAATPAVPAEALNPRVKSLNYLNNILAKMEALEAGLVEAIMLNHMGYVAECTGDNIFIINGNRLITPPVSAGILLGCTRNKVMELARGAGMEVAEENLQRYDLYCAQECFLTGTAAELIPVVKIDGRVIGTGKAGDKTKELLRLFRKFIAEY
jgi:branched-chain amino acid aminotransferase